MEHQVSFAEFPSYFAERFPELETQSVLVALSGGADSVALLHLLSQCKLRLQAAYVDHRSRPHEVKQEISHCRSMCERLNISFHVLRIDNSGDNDSSEGSREANWRRQRYRVLKGLAEEQGITAIATAHHRDDVAEGVLLQLLRGGGPRSMAGIKERTENNIIRPLLPFSHGELVAWLQAQGITWCDDSSNADTSHLRNQVRHELLPMLEKTSSEIRSHLISLAGALAADESFMRERLQERATWINPWSPSGGIDRKNVYDLAPALRSRWLHAQALRIGIKRVSRKQLRLFAAMIEKSSPRSINLGRRWRLRLVAGTLWLEPPVVPAAYEYEFSASAEIKLPIPGWVALLRSEYEAQTPEALIWHVPAGARIVVRSYRQGEYVTEKGRAKRVSTLLARKLPRHLRNAWPLIVVDDTICWIPGVWQGPAINAPQTKRVEVFCT